MTFLTDTDTQRLRRVIDAIAARTGDLHVRARGGCRCGCTLVDAASHRRHLHHLALSLGVLP